MRRNKKKVGTRKSYFGRIKAHEHNLRGPSGCSVCAGKFESLEKQKEKEENGQFSWTLLKHIDAGMCMFGRKGSNNPVEQQHAVQLKDRGQNPFHLANAWCDEVRRNGERADRRRSDHRSR